jgi:hypothetical protein
MSNQRARQIHGEPARCAWRGDLGRTQASAFAVKMSGSHFVGLILNGADARAEQLEVSHAVQGKDVFLAGMPAHGCAGARQLAQTRAS